MMTGNRRGNLPVRRVGYRATSRPNKHIGAVLYSLTDR